MWRTPCDAAEYEGYSTVKSTKHGWQAWEWTLAGCTRLACNKATRSQRKLCHTAVSCAGRGAACLQREAASSGGVLGTAAVRRPRPLCGVRGSACLGRPAGVPAFEPGAPQNVCEENAATACPARRNSALQQHRRLHSRCFEMCILLPPGTHAGTHAGVALAVRLRCEGTALLNPAGGSWRAAAGHARRACRTWRQAAGSNTPASSGRRRICCISAWSFRQRCEITWGATAIAVHTCRQFYVH